MEPTKNPVPKHIGVILDGNRRFARKLMAKPWKGHEWGARKVEALLEWARELGVKELTLYAFSIQNMDRPKEEFDYLMKLFVKEFTDFENDERIEKYKVKVNFLGRIHLLPAAVHTVFKRLADKTKDNDGLVINFAIAYGGREEVVDAVMKLNNDIKNGKVDADKVNEEVFKNYLYTPDEPDIVIRTGGARRTSNFLLWQASYAEYFFVEKTWPEFEKEDFLEIIDEYMDRERRFGK